MNPNKMIYNLHISSRDWDVYCCLVPKRYDGTSWLLFLFYKSSRHHCFCWKGQISMDIILRAIEIEKDVFCSVLEGFIPSTSSKASSKLWVYRLLCPLKLILCLSHKCFFHLPWHLMGPSFNSVTFHHPAGSTWSSYLSRPAWVQLESHLNANRLPSTEAVNQPDIRPNKCNPSNVTLFTNQGDTHDHWGWRPPVSNVGPLLEMNCKHFSYQRHGEHEMNRCFIVDVWVCQQSPDWSIRYLPFHPKIVVFQETTTKLSGGFNHQSKRKTYSSKLDQYLGWDK